MKEIYIKSYFSECNWEEDGLYKVSIPADYEENYKSLIENVGRLLDEIQGSCYPSDREELEELFEDEDFSEVSKDIMRKEFDTMKELGESEGSSLGRTLSVLEKIGFKWSVIDIDEYYDADYTRFR